MSIRQIHSEPVSFPALANAIDSASAVASVSIGLATIYKISDEKGGVQIYIGSGMDFVRLLEAL